MHASRPATESQLAANRANATHSTGPKSAAGKQIASHNALKTGLTGRTVLLPTDDIALYEAHIQRTFAIHRPATDEERSHVDTIVDLEWRLLRIPTLETGIYAIGRKLLAAGNTDEDAAPSVTASLDAEIYLVYQKELKNLHLQESRLVRRLEKELAKLETLQKKRKEEEQARLEEAAAYYRDCLERNLPYDHKHLAEIGFEFSIQEIQRAVAARQARETRTAWPTIQTNQLLKTLQARQSA